MAQHTQQGDFTALTEATMQLAKVQEDLDRKETRWLELAEMSEGA